MVSKHTMTRSLLLLVPFIASCTYAPQTQNTQIEQNYSARIMAIGMPAKSGGITSTTHVGEGDGEVDPLSDGVTVGSTAEEVKALHGRPSSISGSTVWYGGSYICFDKGTRGARVVSWHDCGNLKLKGKRF